MAYAEGKETNKETFHKVSDLGNVNEGLGDKSFSINWQKCKSLKTLSWWRLTHSVSETLPCWYKGAGSHLIFLF